MYPCWIYGLVALRWEKSQVVGWGRPNLVHNVEEKTPYGTWITIHNLLWKKIVLKKFFPCFVFMFPCFLVFLWYSHYILSMFTLHSHVVPKCCSHLFSCSHSHFIAHHKSLTKDFNIIQWVDGIMLGALPTLPYQYCQGHLTQDKLQPLAHSIVMNKLIDA
jgi:hypothetical protein